jgi:hypothetical protein
MPMDAAARKMNAEDAEASQSTPRNNIILILCALRATSAASAFLLNDV